LSPPRGGSTIGRVKRILLVAALAVLALAPAAGANQVAQFTIVGAGHITAPGIDCLRHPGGQLLGTCSVEVKDGPDLCDERGCFPQGGVLTFTAENLDGFQFDTWSHPQCNPRTRNPCGAVFSELGPNPPLTITATFKDAAAPTATLTAPANGAAVRGVIPLAATATDNSGAVANVVFRVAGNPFQTFETPPFTTNFDTRTRVDGPLAISATATDGVGLANASAATVIVDNTNPTLTVTGPDNATFGPGATPTWTLAANDATSDFGVRCSVVPTGRPAVFGNCTSTTLERLVNPADGRYTLTVRAFDAAGNFVEQTRAFAVDTGPPDTAIASGPGDGSSTLDSTLSWGFTASEPGSTFQCRVYLTALGPSAFAPCSGAASHTVGGLGAGNYTFEVRATDVFGNADPTPARRAVSVLAPPPPPPVVHETTIVQQVVVVTLTFSYRDANKKSTRISALVVNSVPAGSTVTARCPKGCAKKTLVKKNAKGNVSLKALAGKKPLKVKTKITVTVSKPGAVSAVKVLVVQKSKAPTVTSFCQPPGAAKPGKCA
jgi:Bacterial Ig domain